MDDAPFGPYRVEARNTSRQSDNQIHDDAVARRFGFAGGLVPGVGVYGYMTHLPVLCWGRAWLERGTAECRFRKPVYDGEWVTVRATETMEGILLEAECRGVLCAVGRAALPDAPAAVPAAFPVSAPPPPALRRNADETTLAVGSRFAIRPVRVDRDAAACQLGEFGETLPLYLAEGLVHPAIVAGLGNWALKDNVVLGPWMHVGSRIEHVSAARIGDELTAHATVTANYEKNGHRFVDLDVIVYADRARPVARLAHLSIYRLRQAAAA